MTVLSTDVKQPKLSDWVMLPILKSYIMWSTCLWGHVTWYCPQGHVISQVSASWMKILSNDFFLKREVIYSSKHSVLPRWQWTVNFMNFFSTFVNRMKEWPEITLVFKLNELIVCLVAYRFSKGISWQFAWLLI